MRVSGGFVGPDPAAVMAAEMSVFMRATRAGVEAGTFGMRDEIRTQIESSGLGRGLGNAVSGEVFPRNKQETLHPAGVVKPRGKKAEQIFISFNDAPVIVTKSGRKLAIATRNAFLGGRGGHRPTPAEFERKTGIKLQVVPSKKPGVSLLMGTDLPQRVRGRRPKYLVYFVLLPFAQNNKRLSFDAVAKKWADRVPEFIESALPQGLR